MALRPISYMPATATSPHPCLDLHATCAPFRPFAGGGLISAILRRQSASCGPETKVPLTFVLYQPDTTPRRSELFCFDMAWRELLHWVLSGGALDLLLGAGGGFSICSDQEFSFSSRRRAGRNQRARPRPGLDDGCRTEPVPRHINSRRSVPLRPPPPMRMPAPKATDFRVSLADHARLSR